VASSYVDLNILLRNSLFHMLSLLAQLINAIMITTTTPVVQEIYVVCA